MNDQSVCARMRIDTRTAHACAHHFRICANKLYIFFFFSIYFTFLHSFRPLHLYALERVHRVYIKLLSIAFFHSSNWNVSQRNSRNFFFLKMKNFVRMSLWYIYIPYILNFVFFFRTFWTDLNKEAIFGASVLVRFWKQSRKKMCFALSNVN